MTHPTHNTEPIGPDDPRLTAYALGELPADEAAGLAAQIDADPALQAKIEAIRSGAAQVEAALGYELSITPAPDAATPPPSGPASGPATAGRIGPRPAWASRPALLAAGLALAAGAAITAVSVMQWGGERTERVTEQDRPILGLPAVREAMAREVAVDFDRAPLGQVVAFLNKQTGTPIDVDWAALGRRGVTPSTAITLQHDQPQPAGRVLAAALSAAYRQSPHPDPAQWAMTDAGVSVAPQSALVQQRLDAAKALLDQRRFSQSPVDPALLTTARPEVWESDRWNQLQAKRKAAGEQVLAEAGHALDTAEQAADAQDYERASNQTLYAYRLLAMHGALLSQDQLAGAFERIDAIKQATLAGQRRAGDAWLAQARQEAEAAGTPLGDYESAMLAAVDALGNKDYKAANDAVIRARTAVSSQRDALTAEQYKEHVTRAAVLQHEIAQTQRRMMTQQLAEAESHQASAAQQATAEAERRKAQEVQARLRSARELQVQQRYDEAITELDAALFLEPDNAVITGFRDMLSDSAVAFETTRLSRHRDLEIANLSLMNIEATTPYGDVLTYPGAWPEPTAERELGRRLIETDGLQAEGLSLGLRGVQPQTAWGVQPRGGAPANVWYDAGSTELYDYDFDSGLGKLSQLDDQLSVVGQVMHPPAEQFGRPAAGASFAFEAEAEVTAGVRFRRVRLSGDELGEALYAVPAQAEFDSRLGYIVQPATGAQGQAASRTDQITAEIARFLETQPLEALDERSSEAVLQVNRLVFNKGELEQSQQALRTEYESLLDRQRRGDFEPTDEERLAVESDEQIIEIDTQLRQLQEARTASLERFIPNHEVLIQFDEQIQLLEQERVRAFDSVFRTMFDARIEQGARGLAAMQQELDQVNASLAEYVAKRRAFVQQRNYYDTLVRELELAEQNEPFERVRIQAVQELGGLERDYFEAMARGVESAPAGDQYALVNDNPFRAPIEADHAMSTFSVDVDTAAYTLVRRQLMQQNQLPVAQAVRIEEMINYFDYGYDAPVVDARALDHGVVTQASLDRFAQADDGFAPFATHVEVTDCPWQAGHQLVRIGIQGMDVSQEDRPTAHLTYLIDVSGSMNRDNKLPLVKQSLKLLLDKLNPEDRVSIVVYAGASGLILENASAADKGAIEDALDRLKAGGSTAGAEGIQLAYDVAERHYIDGGVNRVILCTDGDFNVGVSDTDDLVALIKQKANPPRGDDGVRKGVYLSVLGYGMGNLNDAMMEPLTNAGNGHYAYIDSLQEATRVMYDQAGATMVAIAKDVKVQVHFDPAQVLAYRLIGYENRVLANRDFTDDTVDAGDIGAGHSVTALYEVVPFDFDGGGDLDETIREVKLQIERLEEALALNQSLLSTASLTQEQALKLTGVNRMLEQEHALASAVVARVSPTASSSAGRVSDGAASLPEPVPQPRPEPSADGPAQPDAPDEPVLDEAALADGAMLAVKLRYKPVDAPAEQGTSREVMTKVYAEDAVAFDAAQESTRFAAAVAGYGMLLRNSPHAGDADLRWVLDTVQNARAHDPGQLRSELLDLVRRTIALSPEPEPVGDVDPAIPR